MKLAFISGTSILKSRLFDEWRAAEISTRYGTVGYREKDGFVILNRHGREGVTPPHAINHRANIQALVDLGYREAVALYSVGSLREELRPGTFVSCSDYVSFVPTTFSDEVGNYEAPHLSNHLIPEIREKAGCVIESGKVYVQMIGPRFETRAEIRIIEPWGDVVGMNLASEADLCREGGVRLNTLCMVDNYANGIGGAAITGERFRALVAENQGKVNLLFERLFEMFRG